MTTWNSSFDTLAPGAAASHGTPGVVPGRVELPELAERTRGFDRATFTRRYRAPFLLQLNENGTVQHTRSTARSGRFQTVVGARSLLGAASARLSGRVHAYELKKREGANAFALMVTIGRALNNDIVVPHPSVSKFHASLALDKEGEWTLTDASSNGTWLDGERLVRKHARVVRPPSCMSLAREVILLLLSPDALFDELERFRNELPPAA